MKNIIIGLVSILISAFLFAEFTMHFTEGIAFCLAIAAIVSIGVFAVVINMGIHYLIGLI